MLAFLTLIQKEGHGLFKAIADPAQEARRIGSVDDAVIVG
jgi:hypothetical protein